MARHLNHIVDEKKNLCRRRLICIVVHLFYRITTTKLTQHTGPIWIILWWILFSSLNSFSKEGENQYNFNFKKSLVLLTRKNNSFPLVPTMKTKICQCVLWEMPLIIVYYDQKEWWWYSKNQSSNICMTHQPAKNNIQPWS